MAVVLVTVLKAIRPWPRILSSCVAEDEEQGRIKRVHKVGTIVCYTEKAPSAWHRRGTQKTGNTYCVCHDVSWNAMRFVEQTQ